jgi:hypothetical protein
MADIVRDALCRLARHLPDEGLTHDQVTLQLERMDPRFREYMIEAKLTDGRILWVRNPDVFPPEGTTDPGLRANSRPRMPALAVQLAQAGHAAQGAQGAAVEKRPPSSPLTAPISLVLAGGMFIAGALGVFFTTPAVWKPEVGLPLSFAAIACGAGWAISVRVLTVQANRRAAREQAREALRQAENRQGG